MWDPFAEFEMAQLGNGLKIYVAHWPNRPWVYAGFVVHSGGKDDDPGLEGSAHFVEHLLCHNIPQISHQALNDYSDTFGGWVNFGRTGYCDTNYAFFAPVEETVLTNLLNYFGVMLLDAQLKNSLEEQREIIRHEFLKLFPIPKFYELSSKVHQNLFSGFPIGRMVNFTGNLKTIAELSAQNLQQFFDKHYFPANMSIVLVGGLNISQAIDYLNKSPFGLRKQGKSSPSGQKDLGTFLRHAPKATEVIFWKEIMQNNPQSAQFEARTAVPGDVREWALDIFLKMLYRILMEEIREKRNWAYSLNSSYMDFVGVYEGIIKIPAFNLSAADEIESVIDLSINSIIKREDLFMRMRDFLVMCRNMKDVSAHTLLYDIMVFLSWKNRIVSLAEEIEQIRAISFEEVIKIAEYFLPENRLGYLIK